jgi:hypothetical protein
MGPGRTYGALKTGAPTGDLVPCIFIFFFPSGYTYPHLTTSPAKKTPADVNENELIGPWAARVFYYFFSLRTGIISEGRRDSVPPGQKGLKRSRLWASAAALLAKFTW